MHMPVAQSRLPMAPLAIATSHGFLSSPSSPCSPRSDLNGDGLLDESEFLGAALPTAVIARQAAAALAAAQQAAAAGGGAGGRGPGGVGGSRPGTSGASAARSDPSNPLAAAFAYFDADGSGYITVDELRSALAAHHPTGEGPDIRVRPRPELWAVRVLAKCSHPCLYAASQCLRPDRQAPSISTPAHARHALTLPDDTGLRFLLQALLSRVDADSDGRISYAEFLTMMAAECMEEEVDLDQEEQEQDEGRSRSGQRRSKTLGGMLKLRGANAVGQRSRASSHHSHHSHHIQSPHAQSHKVHGNEQQWPAARGLTGHRSKKSGINTGALSGHHSHRPQQQQQQQQHGGGQSRPSTTQAQSGHSSRSQQRQSGRQPHGHSQHAEEQDDWFEDEEVLPADDTAASNTSSTSNTISNTRRQQQQQQLPGGAGARSGRSRGGQRVTLHMTPSQEERQAGAEAAAGPPAGAVAPAWGGRSRNGREDAGGPHGRHGHAAGAAAVGPHVRGVSAATSCGSTAVVPSLSGRLSPLDGTGWYDECKSPGGAEEEEGEGQSSGAGADGGGWGHDTAMAGAGGAGAAGGGEPLMQQLSVEDSGLSQMMAQQWQHQQQQQQQQAAAGSPGAARRPPALMLPAQAPVATQRSRRHSAANAIPGADTASAAGRASAGGFSVVTGAATDRPPRCTPQPVLAPAPHSGEVLSSVPVVSGSPASASPASASQASASQASAGRARGSQMQQLLLSQLGGDDAASGSGRRSMPASPAGNHDGGGGGSNWFYSPAASPSGRATAQRMLRNELAAASATTAAQYYGGGPAPARQPLTPEQLLMPAPPPSVQTGPIAAGSSARSRRQSTGSPAWPLTQPQLAGPHQGLGQTVSPLSPRLAAAFASTGGAGCDPSGRRQQTQHQHHGGVMLPPGACLDLSDQSPAALPHVRGSGGSTPRGRQQQQAQAQAPSHVPGQLQASPQHQDMLMAGGGGGRGGPSGGRGGYTSEPLPQLQLGGTGTSTVVGGRLATPALGAASSPRQPRPPSGAPLTPGAAGGVGGAGGRHGAGPLPPWGEEVDM